MQFNLRNGPPSTWQTYRVDGDHDGDTDPYDPADAIASAARYLRALLDGARGDIAARRLRLQPLAAPTSPTCSRAPAPTARQPEAALTAPGERRLRGRPRRPTGPANLQPAERRESPRAYAMLPAWAMAGGRPAQPIDARLLDNALWLLRTYRLRVTAAREGGHNTHGDGTALDLVPAEPVDQAAWDASAGALARDLGWTPGVRRAPAAGPRARSCPRSSSSATRATPATARRAPAAAPASRTCTSRGSRRATARARRRRRASGSPRSRRRPPPRRADAGARNARPMRSEVDRHARARRVRAVRLPTRPMAR